MMKKMKNKTIPRYREVGGRGSEICCASAASGADHIETCFEVLDMQGVLFKANCSMLHSTDRFSAADQSCKHKRERKAKRAPQTMTS